MLLRGHCLLIGKAAASTEHVCDHRLPEYCNACTLQVHGKSGNYLTLPTSYCACQAHYYEVVSKSEAPYVSACQMAAEKLHFLAYCATLQAAVYHAVTFLPTDLNSLCQSTLHMVLQATDQVASTGGQTCKARLTNLHALLTKQAERVLLLPDLPLCRVQCKHQLAARLAFILKSCPITTVTDAVLAEHLLGA